MTIWMFWEKKEISPTKIQTMDHPAHSLITLLTMLLQLLNLYVPNENSTPTKYTAKMNHTDTTILIQNVSTTATVIMTVQYKIFHPTVLHIATSIDSQSINSLNHLMCTTTPTEPRKWNMKLTFVSQYIFFTFSNILWQKNISECLYVHRSPLTLTMLSLTAGNISSDSPHYNFWHLTQETAESSIGFKLLLSHRQPVHCVKL